MRFNISRLIPLFVVESNIVGRNQKSISNNYYGNKTGVAFEIIGFALRNPKKTKYHYCSSEDIASVMFELIKALISTNDLKYFIVKINRKAISITYDPFYSNDDYLKIRRTAISKSNNAAQSK